MIIDSLDTLKYSDPDMYPVHFVIKDGSIIELELFFKEPYPFPRCIKDLSIIKTLHIDIGKAVSYFPKQIPKLKMIEELKISEWGGIMILFRHLINFQILKGCILSPDLKNFLKRYLSIV